MAWGDKQQQQEAYGSWQHERSERNRDFREKNMSGEVMEPKPAVSDDDMRRLREFIASHLAHRKDAAAVLGMLGGKQMFVRVDGTLYHVRRSYASNPLELPVIVSEATVIGD